MKCQCGNRNLRLRSRTSLQGITIETYVCPRCDSEGTRTESDRGTELKGCLR